MDQIIVKGSKKHYVSLSDSCHVTYLNMRLLANRGNYWALTAVKEIEALLACNVFKPNVFTYEEAGTNGYAIYKLILPGCVAYAHKIGTGFFIYHLKASLNYQALQESSAKPGLHRIEFKNKQFQSAEVVKNGQIKPMDRRIVTVSDQHRFLTKAIKRSIRAIGSAPNGSKSDDLEGSGFDMHYTPQDEVKKPIGGLYNRKQAANPQLSKDLHESALLLANTMESSLSFKHIRWITEDGGSGVMTQAMKILKDKKINFSGAEHKIFFSNITTDLVKAEQLARDLGLTTSRLTHSRNPFNPHQLFGAGLLGGHQAAWRRYKQEKTHTALKLSTDMVRETSKLVGIPAAFGISGVAVATSVGIPAAVFALPAGLTVALTIGLPLGTKMAEAMLPDLYESAEERF
jgi:hypothetical protein